MSRVAVASALAVALVEAGCGPIRSRQVAISTAEQTVGAVHVTRSDAKSMTWAEWQDRSGDRGGPAPAPAAATRVWVVAIQGRFTKLASGALAVVVIEDASSGRMILATSGGWDWPPYWNDL